MGYYGAGEPLHPVLSAVGAFFGGLAGLAFGIGGFFLATAFVAMLRAALPGMSDTAFVGLWTAALAVPLLAFSRVLRHGKGLGARTYAGCGLATIVLLFAGELTGTISVYPWHVRTYIVPGPYERPATAPPRR